jgi:hypothetical protein
MATKSVATLAAIVMLAGSVSLGPTAAASATSNSLRSELLSLSQMPVGWSVEAPSSGGGGSDAGSCLDDTSAMMPRHVTPTTAFAAFQYGGQLPLLAEVLVERRDAARAFPHAMAGCKTGQMSFPSFGDQSAAYALSLTNFSGFALFERRGSTIMLLFELGSPIFGGAPSVNQFEHFARMAAAKVH